MQGKRKHHPAGTFASVIVTMVAGYVLAIFCVEAAQDRAMRALTVHEGELQARARFWFKPKEETHAHAGPAVGWTTPATRCSSPCTRRLWWVHPLLPDLEAWTIDLDDQGNVIGGHRWSSP